MASDDILLNVNELYRLIKELKETKELIDDNPVLRFKYKVIAQTLDYILANGNLDRIRTKALDSFRKYKLKHQIIQQEEQFELFDDV